MNYALLTIAFVALLFAAGDLLGAIVHLFRGGRFTAFGAIAHPIYIGIALGLGLWLLNLGGWFR